MPRFVMNGFHLRCNSDTSLKVKWSKVRVTDGRGIPCRLNPAATLVVWIEFFVNYFVILELRVHA